MRYRSAILLISVVLIWTSAVGAPGAAAQGVAIIAYGSESEDTLFRRYLGQRFKDLDLTVMSADSSFVAGWEVFFGVMPLTSGTYDVSITYGLAYTLGDVTRRSRPFGIIQYHAYGDLNDVAKEFAERFFTEIKRAEEEARDAWGDSIGKPEAVPIYRRV